VSETRESVLAKSPLFVEPCARLWWWSLKKDGCAFSVSICHCIDSVHETVEHERSKSREIYAGTTAFRVPSGGWWELKLA